MPTPVGFGNDCLVNQRLRISVVNENSLADEAFSGNLDLVAPI